MAGRAYLYALGAAGERGVDRVLDWFRADLIRTMTLVGAGSRRPTSTVRLSRSRERGSLSWQQVLGP